MFFHIFGFKRYVKTAWRLENYGRFSLAYTQNISHLESNSQPITVFIWCRRVNYLFVLIDWRESWQNSSSVIDESAVPDNIYHGSANRRGG